MYGAWFSLLGTVIIVLGNIVLVPLFSYTGSAWAAFLCYFVVMVVSYYFGQKYMPIKYDLKSIGLYFALTIFLYVLSLFINTEYSWLNYLLKTFLLAIFVLFAIKRDISIGSIPILNRLVKRK